MREAAKDRISNLPDSLLHHVLSFLNIKEVARTSVISHRWKYIWVTVPTLHFKTPVYISMPTSSETKKFMDFVDATLHRHKLSNVDKFSLKWCGHLDESRLHSWVSNVLMGNVKVISLYLGQDRPLFIPLSLFTCESLVCLELNTYPSIRLPKYITFPRLKRLKLGGFKISDECWNEDLFSNSPVLEELILRNCEYRIRNFSISIPTLLKIYISCDDGCRFRNCVFIIGCPRLVTFCYSGYVAEEIIIPGFPALAEANVEFCFEGNDSTEKEKMCRLVGALAHVKCLTVNDDTLQAICSTSYLSNNLLTFCNVKMLSISDPLNTDEGLIALVNAVPNLESLVFPMGMRDEEDNDEDDSDCTEKDGDDEDENNDAESVEGENNHDNDDDDDEGEESDEDNIDCTAKDGDDEDENNDAESVEGENNHDNEDEGDGEFDNNDKGEANYDNKDDGRALGIGTAGCLFPRLKSVCFECFVGNPKEMNWVKLILDNAKDLQLMTIRYDASVFRSANEKSEKEHMVEIQSLPRASAGCVFKFSS